MAKLNHYDIIIVGAGIAGLTLAKLLGDHGLRIAIFERQLHIEPITTDFNLRVSAINLHSQKIFQTIGVWSDMEKHRMAAFKKMYVWDSISQANVELKAQDFLIEQLGYIIENNVMLQSLFNSLKALNNVEIVSPIQLDKLTIDSEAACVITQAGDKYSADLIVGSDGAQSWVREQAGIELHQYSYQQSALVATVSIEKTHDNTAYQCFLPSGPLAFLPLPDPRQCSIVWSTQPAIAEELSTLDTDAFACRLTYAFEKKLGDVKLLSQRKLFPLTMRHAKQYCRERVVLIGDAAHTIHPLAGQGLNLGIADANELTKIITDARQSQRKFFKLHTLKKYQRARLAANWKMIAAMEGFKRLFQSQHISAIKLRAWGLQTINRHAFLKQFFIQAAEN